jgi:hypothetical protein
MEALTNSYIRAKPSLPWPPDEKNENSRAIGERVWRLDDFHAIAAKQLSVGAGGNLVIPITNECIRDLQKLGLERPHLATLILDLRDHHYEKSMWCRASRREGVRILEAQLWHPCDAYAITRKERVSTGWEGNVDYYLKMCLNSAGSVVLLASAHLQK